MTGFPLRLANGDNLGSNKRKMAFHPCIELDMLIMEGKESYELVD